MSYSALDDLKKKIDPDRLVELTDTTNNPPTTADTVKTDRAIQDADALIDSYVSKRYMVPLIPTPLMAREASATVAIYYLHVFRGLDPDLWRRRFEDTVSWLGQVAAGAVNLEGVTAEPSPSTGSVADFSADDRAFSRETLKGF